MLIRQIPHPLRNTVEYLELPLYIDLTATDCRPPMELALGDTLMVLGLIRNQGKPVRLHLDPGPARQLVQSHPLVKELAAPDGQPSRFKLRRLPVQRSGRKAAWVSDDTYRLPIPVAPLDQIKANPITAHSLYYKLDNNDDRPSVYIDPGYKSPLADLLSKKRPNLVVYPFNPGRADSFWQDVSWWRRLLAEVSSQFHLIAVGAHEYGELSEAVDQVLPMDDPASTLKDVAWLLSRAEVFAGRDGGISHLAAGVNHRFMVVWDSMASYRFWAGRGGNHLVMSNPYSFRYPQTMRVAMGDLRAGLGAIALPDKNGQIHQVSLPKQGFDEKAVELFGSLDAFMQNVLTSWEIEDDRAGVSSWMEEPKFKETFYKQSLDFAARVLTGSIKPGINWVAPTIL